MSPRRRLFVLVLIGAVLVGAAGAGVAALLAGRGTSASAARVVPPDEPGPVLLVPGYGGSVTALGPLAARLRAAGRDVTVVALPGNATGDLRTQATAVDSAARAALRRTGAPSVDVVGYSAGGVVVRLWVRDGGRAVVRRVVTVAAPHHGTELAGVAGSLLPGLCPVACQQLSAGSDLLRELNRGDETPDGPTWLSVFSARDAVVTPPTTARLAGARNVAVQSVCAGDDTDHGQLPSDPLVIGLVVRDLGPARGGGPQPQSCTALRALGSR